MDRSPLEKLPAEVRLEIYKYLLSAPYVKHEPSDSEVATYHFHPAILGTNRFIHGETAPELYQKNLFVIVSSDYIPLFSSFRQEKVAVVSTVRLGKFKQHSLLLRVDRGMSQPGMRSTALMLAEDLPALVTSLRMLCLTTTFSEPDGLRLKMRLRGTSMRPELELGRQKSLLAPFEGVHGRQVSATVSPNLIDSTYRLQLLRAMNPRVFHVHHEAWDAYRFAKHLKSSGDEAFRAGNFTRAVSRYVSCWRLLDRCLQTRPGIEEMNPKLGWRETTQGLVQRGVVNFLLAVIRDRDFRWFLGASPFTWTRQQSPYAARIHHYLGVCYAGASNQDEAIENFLIALDFDLNYEEAWHCLRVIVRTVFISAEQYEEISQPTADDQIIEEDATEDEIPHARIKEIVEATEAFIDARQGMANLAV